MPLFITPSSTIESQQFIADINKYVALITPVDTEQFVLFNPDSYQFSCQFLALLHCNKHIVLPANGQPETLAKLAKLPNTQLFEQAIKQAQLLPSIIQPTYINSLAQLWQNKQANISFFTSGSTGEPKQITKTFAHLWHEVENLTDTFTQLYKNTDSVVATVSHFHIYGLLFKILVPLALTKPIVVDSFEYPEHLADYLAHHAGNTCIISSPAHLKRLTQDNVLIPSANKISGIISSGGELSYQISQRITAQLAITPTEIYGSTETGGIAWRIQNNSKTPWQVFNGIEYFVTPEQTTLGVKSPYFAEPEFITEDKVESVNNCEFYLLGRNDRTLKLEEKRVNLTQLEQKLASHEWVNAAKVIVLEHNQRQRLAAVVAVNQQAFNYLNAQGKRALNQIFSTVLLTEFERIALPKKWRYVIDFPTNAQGKVTNTDLINLFTDD